LARHESLPLLHRPRRAAPPSQRAAALQREFEALGCYELSNFKSPPMQRRSRVHIQPESSRALDFAPGSGSISPVPMPPPPLTPPSFGSIVNVLELRVAEARVQRQQVDEANCGAASSERMLEAASRMNSEECLLALRQLAAVISPKLGPVLLRIADSLEPVLFSTAHRDIEGHRLTYEQVVKLVLSPRVADEVRLRPSAWHSNSSCAPAKTRWPCCVRVRRPLCSRTLQYTSTLPAQSRPSNPLLLTGASRPRRRRLCAYCLLAWRVARLSEHRRSAVTMPRRAGSVRGSRCS